MKLDELAGNDSIKEELKIWALNWQRGKRQQPIMLYGPTGVGKTSFAHAVAETFDWELIETNAGELRNADNLKSVIGSSASTGSLFGGLRLVVIDEVEYLDRGGMATLVRIVRDALQPMILVADDYWSLKLSAIRTICFPLQLKKVSQLSIEEVLNETSKKEGIAIDPVKLKEIAQTSQGDLRGAIVDLRAGIASDREREIDVFNAVKNIFKTMKYSEAMQSNFQFSDLDLLVAWLEENAFLEYDRFEDFALAMDYLSKSAVFKGRIMRKQNFTYLRYVAALAIAGVALSKREPYKKFVKYQFPSRIKMLSNSAKSRALLKHIGLKMGEKLHCSSRDALKDIVFQKKSAGFFGFEDEEGGFFERFGKTGN